MNHTAAITATTMAPHVTSCVLSLVVATTGSHSRRPINSGALSRGWPGLAVPASYPCNLREVTGESGLFVTDPADGHVFRIVDHDQIVVIAPATPR